MMASSIIAKLKVANGKIPGAADDALPCGEKGGRGALVRPRVTAGPLAPSGLRASPVEKGGAADLGENRRTAPCKTSEGKPTVLQFGKFRIASAVSPVTARRVEVASVKPRFQDATSFAFNRV